MRATSLPQTQKRSCTPPPARGTVIDGKATPGGQSPRKAHVKTLLIEGWRGINHSYAMVNQYTLCELCKYKDIVLLHRDLPFHFEHWSTVDNNPHFPPAMARVIDGVAAAAPDQPVDTVLRILFPFRRSAAKATRILTYMTGEFGLRATSFAPDHGFVANFIDGDNAIVVPSRWSRMKLVEYGFPADKIHLVPCGVSTDIFSPMTADERAQARRDLGFSPDEFVFLNLGAMSSNKGIDLLIPAFAAIRQRHKHVRLLLKDDRRLYGISGLEVVRTVLTEHPGVATPDLIGAIRFLSTTFPLAEMRRLYGLADTYVSPYRAEGFNLPVIEALGCGTPAIVTAGGSTDDFCEPRTSWMIPARHVDNASKGIKGTGFHLEPDLDALIMAMDDAVRNPRSTTPSFAAGREQLLRDFAWSTGVARLTALL